MPPEPWIRVRDLSVTFGDEGADGPDRLLALDRLDLDVGRGELVCVLGPSGCGKSTLLNVLTGFIRPDSGQVLIDGRQVRGPDRRRLCVVQESAVFPWLTVAENIAFGMPQPEAAAREAAVQAYLELVGLTGFADAYPRELSGGMRQRVEIARALAARGDTLFLDEPFAALDLVTRMRLRQDLLRLWQRERNTILFVTHDLEEAIQLGDRIVVLSSRPGRIVADLPVRMLRPRTLTAAEAIRLRTRIAGILLEVTPIPRAASPSSL